MVMSRPSFARSAASFGRRSRGVGAGEEQCATSLSGNELRLFALTFAGGFLFVSVYLA